MLAEAKYHTQEFFSVLDGCRSRVLVSLHYMRDTCLDGFTLVVNRLWRNYCFLVRTIYTCNAFTGSFSIRH